MPESNQQAADRARAAARQLSYNRTPAEAATKHRLLATANSLAREGVKAAAVNPFKKG